MADDLAEIRRDLGAIRESVGAIRGRQDANSEAIARIDGRVETIFATLTAGQGEQDDRINQLAVKQGRQEGEASARRFWQGVALPGGVAGIISLLLHLIPWGHHP